MKMSCGDDNDDDRDAESVVNCKRRATKTQL